MRATLYANWKQGWQIKGEVQATQVELKEIVTLFTPSTRLTGRLNAHGTYSMSAKAAGQLADNLRGNFKFDVQRGVLYGLDFERAVKTLATQGTRGGQTRFETLSGTLLISGRQYQLNKIKVTSGMLSAEGNVTIAPNKQLRGNVDVAVVPGSAFGLEGYLRLSFATSMRNLEKALARIHSALA